MDYLIGLDVGTSGAKAILLNTKGKVIATASSAYDFQTPHPLWAEQDPEVWWKGTIRAFRGVLASARVDPAKVRSIGLTGQMHGLVMLGKNGNVLRPCIMWNDQRTGEECRQMLNKVGARRMVRLTGNTALPGFTAPKILWVRKHEPKIFERTRQILLPKDYIRFRLTGEYCTEVSDASGTALLDVRKRTWSRDMVSATRVPSDWLPPVVESPEVTGQLSRTAATRTGLPAGIPVVGGGGDQAAGAVGSGVVKPGVILVVVGTSGVVFAHSNGYKYERDGRLHAFCHAVPGAWHLMGVTLSAGGSLSWFHDALGKHSFDDMMRSAGGTPAGSRQLLFLPYLTGERTPHPDPRARGAFVGLTVRHGMGDMVRSVLEGVAFSLRDCMDLIRGTDVRIGEVRVSGGGVRSPVWRRIIADVLDREVVTVTSTEGAPFGAALLAGVGAGIFSDVNEACAAAVRVVSRTEPRAQNARIYKNLHVEYRRSYPALRHIFANLSDHEAQAM